MATAAPEMKRFPAGPGDNTNPVEFPALHANVPMRNGETGRYFGRCLITRCHRVGLVSKVSQPDKPVYDIWLLDDFGRNRCSPGPSDHDYLPNARGLAEEVAAGAAA